MTQKNNGSGQSGVYFHIKKKKWIAMIGFKKRRIYLGEFDEVEEAISARRSAEKRYAEEAAKSAMGRVQHDTVPSAGSEERKVEEVPASEAGYPLGGSGSQQ